MIVDFHTHVFPDRIAGQAIDKLKLQSGTRPFTDGTMQGLRASMEKASVDASVILPVATNPDKLTSLNDTVISINAECSPLLSFGAIHPDALNWREELRRLSDAGVRGIKLHPVYQNVDFDDIRCLRILETAGEKNMIVVTHAGYDIGRPGVNRCSPEMIRRALSAVGPVRIVAAHMGGWRMWEEAIDALAGTGAYIDTAFSLGRLTPLEPGSLSDSALRLLEADAFASLVHAFGADHVLFGSDSPWGDQEKDIQAIQALPLTKTEKEAILGKNAANLLGV